MPDKVSPPRSGLGHSLWRKLWCPTKPGLGSGSEWACYKHNSFLHQKDPRAESTSTCSDNRSEVLSPVPVRVATVSGAHEKFLPWPSNQCQTSPTEDVAGSGMHQSLFEVLCWHLEAVYRQKSTDRHYLCRCVVKIITHLIICSWEYLKKDKCSKLPFSHGNEVQQKGNYLRLISQYFWFKKIEQQCSWLISSIINKGGSTPALKTQTRAWGNMSPPRFQYIQWFGPSWEWPVSLQNRIIKTVNGSSIFMGFGKRTFSSKVAKTCATAVKLWCKLKFKKNALILFNLSQIILYIHPGCVSGVFTFIQTCWSGWVLIFKMWTVVAAAPFTQKVCYIQKDLNLNSYKSPKELNSGIHSTHICCPLTLTFQRHLSLPSDYSLVKTGTFSAFNLKYSKR